MIITTFSSEILEMNSNDNWKWHSTGGRRNVKENSSKMRLPWRQHSRHSISNADEFIKIDPEQLRRIKMHVNYFKSCPDNPPITCIIKHWMTHKIMLTVHSWKVLWNSVLRLHAMLIMNHESQSNKIQSFEMDHRNPIENFFPLNCISRLCTISLSDRTEISHETTVKTIATMLLIRQSNVICIHYNIRLHFKIKWNSFCRAFLNFVIFVSRAAE